MTKIKLLLKLSLFFGAVFLGLFLFNCGKRDTSPVAPETSEAPFEPSATGGVSFQISHYGGDPFTLSPSAVVDHTDPSARIWVEFESQMVADTTGISLKRSDGTIIPIHLDWQVGPTTVLIVTPISDLDHNSTYVFEIKAAQVRDVAGNMLDLDGDGKGGETPDDDLYDRFTTHREGDEFQDLDHDGEYDNLQYDENGDPHYFCLGEVGEPFWDEPPYNNLYDDGETFDDLNGNGFYDAGERYFDNNGNWEFDRDGEPFEDKVNHNGICDLGEFFRDLDGDSTWDPAEPYTDVNGNGRYNYTELRYDADGDGIYDPGDGDTYADIETPNSRCDYAEPFTNLDHDSTKIDGHVDSTGAPIWVPEWDDAEPVYRGYDYDGDGEYDPAVTIGLGGDPWDPPSAPFKLVKTPTDTVRIRFIGYSEPFTDTDANRIWNWPEDDYWIDAISNGVYDASGENLTVDLDNDGNYGEPQPGTPVPPTLDDMRPYVKRTPYYLIGAQEVSTIWTDVSIAVDLADDTYDAYGEVVTQAVSQSTVDTSTVILREADSKLSVTGTVTYDNVVTSPTYFRVTFNPAEDLEAGTDYELVLKAQEITDAAGNKLSNTADIIYKFTTADRNSDGSVVADDIIRPDVDHFSNNYDGTFSVYFTEEIDKQTINNATIVLTYNGKRVIGTLSLGAWDVPASPSGIGTTVTFKPLDRYISSGSVVVTAEIKDLAGNRKGHDNQWNW